MSQQQPLTLGQLRQIFRRNYGAANQLAIEEKVGRAYMSRVLHGRDKGLKLLEPIRRRAAELVAASARGPTGG